MALESAAGRALRTQTFLFPFLLRRYAFRWRRRRRRKGKAGGERGKENYFTFVSRHFLGSVSSPRPLFLLNYKWEREKGGSRESFFFCFGPNQPSCYCTFWTKVSPTPLFPPPKKNNNKKRGFRLQTEPEGASSSRRR